MTGDIQYQGMPPSSTPLLNLDGTLNVTWYRFFQSLFIRSGLNTPNFGVNLPKSVDGTLKQRIYPQFYATDPTSAATKVLVMRNQLTGSLIGLIGYTP